MPSYTQVNVGIAREFLLPNDPKPMTVRFDIVNLFDTDLRDQGRLRHRRVRAAIRAAPRLLPRRIEENLTGATNIGRGSMRPHFASCIAALFAIAATAQAGVGTEAKEASGAQLLLAGGGPPSLYTWNSRPKHDESRSGDHLTWPPKSRRHKQ